MDIDIRADEDAEASLGTPESHGFSPNVSQSIMIGFWWSACRRKSPNPCGNSPHRSTEARKPFDGLGGNRVI